MVQPLASLLGEHAALGDDGEVEALDDAGVDLDAAVRQVLQCRDRRAEARAQPLRLGARHGQPFALQHGHQLAIGQHRAEHRHRFVGGPDAQLGFVGQAGQRQAGRRLLRDVHFADRLRRLGRPAAQTLQQLHAAQRQRQRASVGGHVLVERARVEQRDPSLRQHLRRVQRQRQPDRSGSDHRDVERRRLGKVHRRVLFAAPGRRVDTEAAMALMDFIKKQFIDIIEWTEDSDGTLAWRFPIADREIQYGAMLTVRESQLALFVNEGTVADLFAPGLHKLTTQTLPVLTYLKNWDKLFQSPFKSDVYFFSTRQQVDQRWGTTQPVTIRDKDFGAVRLRAFGNYSYRVQDPKKFHTEISGTRERYTVADLDGQLRALMLQHISDAVAESGIPFLDLAANQVEFAAQLRGATAAEFEKIGLALETVTVQSVSLPDELQKILDQKIGMGMVGNDMGRFMQYQTGQAIPKFAEASGGGGGGIAGDAMGLGAGVALGQSMAHTLQQGLQGGAQGAAAAAIKPDEVMATIEKLADLKAKGVLTDEEFSAKKAELLKKLV